MDHRKNEVQPLCSQQPQYIVDNPSESSWCSLAVVGLSATAVLAYTFYPAADVSTQVLHLVFCPATDSHPSLIQIQIRIWVGKQYVWTPFL